MVIGWKELVYSGVYNDNPYWNYFNKSGVLMLDTDTMGCSHGYPNFMDNKYTQPLSSKYYSYCTASQTNEIGIGAASWNGTSIDYVKKAASTSEASVFLYDTNIKDSSTLAYTQFYISGNWSGDYNVGNWSKARIFFNREHGVISSDTVAHEFGHSLGLSHRISNKNSIMCQVRFGRKVNSVQFCDFDVAKHIYFQ